MVEDVEYEEKEDGVRVVGLDGIGVASELADIPFIEEFTFFQCDPKELLALLAIESDEQTLSLI